MRSRWPIDRLLVVFDIDGTILDTRHVVLDLLKSYDLVHGTNVFRNLGLVDITTHEDQVTGILSGTGVPTSEATDIVRWYETQQWDLNTMLESHKPFSGVMELIQWFQDQDNTYVGLNTGRSENLRDETLYSLNRIDGRPTPKFTSELLQMNSLAWGQVEESKVLGIQRFQDSNYKIVAMIDNEPSNLAAISRLDSAGGIMLLHADTIFKGTRDSLPTGTLSGNVYDLSGIS
jgi:ribulose bisphosphate carboxylase small subunit